MDFLENQILNESPLDKVVIKSMDPHYGAAGDLQSSVHFSCTLFCPHTQGQVECPQRRELKHCPSFPLACLLHKLDFHYSSRQFLVHESFALHYALVATLSTHNLVVVDLSVAFVAVADDAVVAKNLECFVAFHVDLSSG